VATDQQLGGLAVSLVIDRVTASRLGIAPSTLDNALYDAFGQRQISTMYTQVNQYHVILESQPQFQLDPTSLTIFTSSPMPLPAQAGRSLFLFCVFRIIFRGIKCADNLRTVHSGVKCPCSSCERAFAEQLHGVQQGAGSAGITSSA